jgi:hypothetical protein
VAAGRQGRERAGGRGGREFSSCCGSSRRTWHRYETVFAAKRLTHPSAGKPGDAFKLTAAGVGVIIEVVGSGGGGCVTRLTSMSTSAAVPSSMPKETPLFFECCFPYICPEPVLVKRCMFISNWRQHGWRFFTIQQLLLVNLIDVCSMHCFCWNTQKTQRSETKWTCFGSVDSAVSLSQACLG